MNQQYLHFQTSFIYHVNINLWAKIRYTHWKVVKYGYYFFVKCKKKNPIIWLGSKALVILIGQNCPFRQNVEMRVIATETKRLPSIFENFKSYKNIGRKDLQGENNTWDNTPNNPYGLLSIRKENGGKWPTPEMAS